MMKNKKPITVLLAEDDADDRLTVREAFVEARLLNDMRYVVDGQDLMDYLLHEGKYTAPAAAPRPGIILLDFNMPKKDGREALREIKAHPDLRRIPVVVLTTSKAEEDVFRSYDLGANSFITKPVTFSSMVETIKVLGEYWFEIVELPKNHNLP